MQQYHYMEEQCSINKSVQFLFGVIHGKTMQFCPKVFFWSIENWIVLQLQLGRFDKKFLICRRSWEFCSTFKSYLVVSAAGLRNFKCRTLKWVVWYLIVSWNNMITEKVSPTIDNVFHTHLLETRIAKICKKFIAFWHSEPFLSYQPQWWMGQLSQPIQQHFFALF